MSLVTGRQRHETGKVNEKESDVRKDYGAEGGT